MKVNQSAIAFVFLFGLFLGSLSSSVLAQEEEPPILGDEDAMEPWEHRSLACKNDIRISFGATADGTPLTSGTMINDSVQFNSVTFKARRSQRGMRGPWLDGMIFDAQRTSGSNTDLKIPAQGKMLIISQNNKSNDPLDNAKGGQIMVTFDIPSRVKGLNFIDTQEGGTVDALDKDMKVIRSFNVPVTANKTKKYLNTQKVVASFLKITLKGTGAIDDLTIWRNCNLLPKPSSPPTLSPAVPATASPTVCKNDYVISFEADAQRRPLTKGTRIDESVQFNGASFKARRKQDEGRPIFNAGMIFDTRMVTGGDNDLGLPVRKNVLIISQDFDSNQPNDNDQGGEIVGEFDRLVKIKDITFVDIEESGGKIEVYGDDGKLLKRIAIPARGNKTSQVVKVGVGRIRRLVIALAGSGAVDNVRIWRSCDTRAPTVGPTSSPKAPPATLSPTFAPTTFTAAPTVCKNDFVLNFEADAQRRPLRKGAVIDKSVQFNGATIKAQRKEDEGTNLFNAGMIFDTRMVTGGDNDLDIPTRKNVLIISEDLDSNEPNDNDQGGIIVVDFDRLVKIKDIAFLDIEETGSKVELFGDSGSLLRMFAIPARANGSVQVLKINVGRIRKMVITLVGSGAVDNIRIWRNCRTMAPTVGPTEAPSFLPTSVPTFPPTTFTASPTVCKNDFAITFENDGRRRPLRKGDVIDENVIFNGVALKAQRKEDEGTGLFNAGMIFDTRMVTGGDDDLGVAVRKNVLIISEDLNSDEPNDNDQGGIIIGEFDRLVKIKDIKFLDIEEAGGTIQAFGDDGTLLKTIRIPRKKNGSVQLVKVNVGRIRRIVITLTGSGAVDDIRIWRNCRTFAPTVGPTGSPTASPSFQPTEGPTSLPTSAPSSSPTASPSSTPSQTPSYPPSSLPSDGPTSLPTSQPTGSPMASPSEAPSQVPSYSPSTVPTDAPTSLPTSSPSGAPVASPSTAPSEVPSYSPSALPTDEPTSPPTSSPTGNPVASPSAAPSEVPSYSPSLVPTDSPTSLPTISPSGSPIVSPSESPSEIPSYAPSALPTDNPTSLPTVAPTDSPVAAPSESPSQWPSPAPSDSPTPLPTSAPTTAPTEFPVASPSATPSTAPSVPPSTLTGVPTICVSEYVIDFERNGFGRPLRAGDVIDESDPFNGVRFSATRAQDESDAGPPEAGMIFNAASVTGGDDDLDLPEQGNILIISADFDTTNPSDNAQGGTITAEFQRLVTVQSLKLLDVEEGATIQFLGDGGVLIVEEIIAPGASASGAIKMVALDVALVRKLVIVLSGSGALDDIAIARPCITEAPSVGPTTAPTTAPSTPPTLDPTSAPTVCLENVVLDFESLRPGADEPPLPKGSVIDDALTFVGGAVVEARRSQRGPNGAFDDGMIFDTAMPSGNDFDLAMDLTRGKILIISADDDPTDPDDAGQGGDIRVSFSRGPVTLNALKLIDVEKECTILVFGEDTATPLKSIPVPAGQDGAVRTIDIDTSGVRRLMIVLKSSGAVDDIDFSIPCRDTEAPTSVPTSGPTQCEEINYFEEFNTDAAGQALERGARIDETVLLGGGLTFKAQRAQDANSGVFIAGMIFDTANVSGNDNDLAQVNRGNILIISDNPGKTNDPDDNFEGGVIRGNFADPVFLQSITFIDTEEAGGTIEAFKADNSLITSVPIPAVSDGGFQIIVVNATETSLVIISLAGSGAIDNVDFTQLCI